MNKSDEELTFHPGHIPVTPIIWPTNSHHSNQIQQIKGSAKPQVANAPPTTQPGRATVPPRTTPDHVSNVRVMTRPAEGGQKTVIVQFAHPSGPYFQGASVYLKRAGGQPTQVASGNKSPLTFAVPATAAPHAVHVTSWGPWGETNVLTSPGARVRLV